MDLQDSVQRSLQNPAEKILQIFTDSQRLKIWVFNRLRQLRPKLISDICSKSVVLIFLDRFLFHKLLKPRMLILTSRRFDSLFLRAFRLSQTEEKMNVNILYQIRITSQK